jgi:hypothetical protein
MATPPSEAPAPTLHERVLVGGAAGRGETPRTLPDAPGSRPVSLPMPTRRTPWAPVRAVEVPAAAPPPPRRRARVRWRWLVIAVVIASLASLALAWWLRLHFSKSAGGIARLERKDHPHGRG